MAKSRKDKVQELDIQIEKLRNEIQALEHEREDIIESTKNQVPACPPRLYPLNHLIQRETEHFLETHDIPDYLKDDVCQEIAIAVWQAYESEKVSPTYKSSCNIRRKTEYAVCKFLRNEVAHSDLVESVDPDQIALIIFNEMLDDGIDNIDSSIIQTEVRKVLEGDAPFTERERNFIYLRYEQGYTLKEIGQVYGCTVQRASQIGIKILHRSKNMARFLLLRKYLK